jgi:hypothetical protein
MRNPGYVAVVAELDPAIHAGRDVGVDAMKKQAIKLKPRSVLLDNNVVSYGNTAHMIRVPVAGLSNQLLLVQAKPARSPAEQWLRAQIEALPTIARLARERELELHTYIELDFEQMRSRQSFPANLFGDVFEGINLERVEPAVDRSIFFQSEEHISGAAQKQFCCWLLKDFSERLLEKCLLDDRLDLAQLQRLRNVSRYREICKSLHQSQFVDGFHLWTGEIHGLEYFLTADQKFVRALAANEKLALACTPIFPQDLLRVLGVVERDPLPFEYGRRYYLNGIPYE